MNRYKTKTKAKAKTTAATTYEVITAVVIIYTLGFVTSHRRTTCSLSNAYDYCKYPQPILLNQVRVY